MRFMRSLAPSFVACRVFLGVAIAALTGCAGVEISTLKPAEIERARTAAGEALRGYVIYEPMTVMTISMQDVCPKTKAGSDECAERSVRRCVIGPPFQMPNLSRPYLISIKSGFGKAGVEVSITDGWQLGQIKDQSDNTAVLDFLSKTFMQNRSADDCKAGLLRLDLVNGMPKLVRLETP